MEIEAEMGLLISKWRCSLSRIMCHKQYFPMFYAFFVLSAESLIDQQHNHTEHKIKLGADDKVFIGRLKIKA